jgi:hypothetical protein
MEREARVDAILHRCDVSDAHRREIEQGGSAAESVKEKLLARYKAAVSTCSDDRYAQTIGPRPALDWRPSGCE